MPRPNKHELARLVAQDKALDALVARWHELTRDDDAYEDSHVTRQALHELECARTGEGG